MWIHQRVILYKLPYIYNVSISCFSLAPGFGLRSARHRLSRVALRKAAGSNQCVNGDGSFRRRFCMYDFEIVVNVFAFFRISRFKMFKMLRWCDAGVDCISVSLMFVTGYKCHAIFSDHAVWCFWPTVRAYWHDLSILIKYYSPVIKHGNGKSFIDTDRY